MTTDAEYRNFFNGLKEAVEFGLGIRHMTAEAVGVVYASFLRDAYSIVSSMVSEAVPMSVAVMAEVEKNPWLKPEDEGRVLQELVRRKKENPGENPIESVRSVMEALRGAKADK